VENQCVDEKDNEGVPISLWIMISKGPYSSCLILTGRSVETLAMTVAGATRSVVTRGVVTRGVVTRGVVTRGVTVADAMIVDATKGVMEAGATKDAVAARTKVEI